MPTTLMSGERLIRQHRKGLGITTHRLLLEEKSGSSVDSLSAPLSEVSLCEVRLRPKHWLLALAVLALAAGALFDPASAAGLSGTRSIARGLIIFCVPAGVLGWLYWQSWQAVLTIRIGDARRVIGFPRAELPALQEFVRALHQARENYVGAGRAASLAHAPSQPVDGSSLARLSGVTAEAGSQRGRWRVPSPPGH